MNNEGGSVRNRGGTSNAASAKEGAQSHRPKDSAFRQQRLPAWQPILTAGTVVPTFFVLGVAFLPIGVCLLYFSHSVHEISVDYTRCHDNDGYECADLLDKQYEAGNLDETCVCNYTRDNMKFDLEEDWEAPVFMYYGLTNFYQNHRRYVKSRDDHQLLGDLESEPSSDCDPFAYDKDGKKYAPCGAIANSLFSDNLRLFYLGSNDKEPGRQVDLIRKGIAWESDKSYKFKNPELKEGETLEEAFKRNNAVKPKDWRVNPWELDLEDPSNNGFQNEDLIVWMRTAALPNFRKIYRKVNHTGMFEKGLPKGTYAIEADYNFRVTSFSGTKSVILSTTSFLGGKNPFLGIAFVSVGVLCLLLGVIFLIVHLKFGKQTNEMVNINARTPYN